MGKILLIAKRDYLASVRTKAFLFGLIIAPLLFGGGSFLGLALMKGSPDLQTRHIAVVDRTGIAANAIIDELRRQNARDLLDKTTGAQVTPHYEFEIVSPDGSRPEAQRLLLSDRVRHKELFAFVEIGPNVLHPDKDTAHDSPAHSVGWYSNEGGFNEALRWVTGPLNDGIRRVRLARLGVEAGRFDEVLHPVLVENMNLVSRDVKTGQIVTARPKGNAEGFLVPMVLGILLVMIVLTASGPMLPAIAEDKMQRVFEILLASATPFELVAGKILAAIGIALTSSVIYIAAGLFMLQGLAMVGLAPLGILPWFLVYLIAEVVMLSALAAALGAACSSAQDAQSFRLIPILPVMIPLFLMTPVVQQPNGPVITALSLFPLFTPLLMLMRQASPGGIPAWQPWVGLAGVAIATVAVSWLASRIFRAAILFQGKTPSLPEILR